MQPSSAGRRGTPNPDPSALVCGRLLDVSDPILHGDLGLVLLQLDDNPESGERDQQVDPATADVLNLDEGATAQAAAVEQVEQVRVPRRLGVEPVRNELDELLDDGRNRFGDVAVEVGARL